VIGDAAATDSLGPAPSAAKLSAAELSAIATRLYRYGARFGRLLQRYRPFICPFEEVLADVPAGARVLDVGCGRGLLLGLLATSGRIKDAVGFDSSAPAIAEARSMARSAGLDHCLTFTRLDAEADWPDGAFDVVTMVDVLHHVPPAAQRAVILQAAGAVRPGGRFIYKDMASRPSWMALANRPHDLLLVREWIHSAALEEVESRCLGAGLRPVRRYAASRFWYRHEALVLAKPEGQTPDRTVAPVPAP
jgi:2-polyprenyl-3-methyl-5-hydroxy-6-metoxy-1,4-benzoquinol methylase